MLFASGFKEVLTILANIYCGFQFQLSKLSEVSIAIATKALEKKLNQIKVNIQSIANKILYVPLPLPANNNALKKNIN